MLVNSLAIISVFIFSAIILFAFINKKYKQVMLPLMIVTFNFWFFVYPKVIPLPQLHSLVTWLFIIIFVCCYSLIFWMVNLFGKSEDINIKKSRYSVLIALLSIAYLVLFVLMFIEYSVVFS